ncbi:MAG: ParA family protein [Janthinobacterium lividum]
MTREAKRTGTLSAEAQNTDAAHKRVTTADAHIEVRPDTRGPAKLLTISSSKGGSTKTTTARNLAVAAAHQGLRVCTVNLDAQPTLTAWARARKNVPGAPAIEHRAIAAKGSMPEIRALIEEGGYDVVVVDTPPGVESHPVELRMLIRDSDLVVLTTQQASADLDSVVEWAKTVRREGAPFTFLLGRTARQQRNFDEAKSRLNGAGDLCPFDVRSAASVDDTDKLGIGNMEIKGDRCGVDFVGAWGYVRKRLGLPTSEIE